MLPFRQIPRIIRLTRPTQAITYSYRSASSLREKLNDPNPSQQYLSHLGDQPAPPNPEDDLKPDPEEEKSLEKVPGFSREEKLAVKKAMKRRSLKMSFWQMLLITFVGSCVLNIMREKNYRDELDDNYRIRFKKFEEIIERYKRGDVVIEDIEQEFKVLNERFEIFQLPKSEFDGVRGLDKKEWKKTYREVKGVDLNPKKNAEASDSSSSNDAESSTSVPEYSDKPVDKPKHDKFI